MTAQTPPCPVRSLVIDPSNTSVLYAIGAGGLFASSDGGAAWRLLYSGVSFPAGFSQTLTIDPRDSQHLFLSIGNALVESRDSGRNWTELTFPQTPGFVVLQGLSGVAIDRFDGSLYVVVYNRPPFGVGRRVNYLYKSADGGQTWSSLLLGDPGMTAPILGRSSAGRLFVGIYGHGEVATDPPGGYLYGGILMSRDGGLTWSTISSSGPWCTNLVADSVDPNSFYAVVACDTYVTSDEGTNWVIFPSRNDCRVGYLVSGPSEVFANGEYGVLISPKGLFVWLPFLPPGNTLFAVDPSNDDVLYVGRGSALLKSVDGGRTFDTLCEAPGRRSLQRSGPRSPVRPVAPRN